MKPPPRGHLTRDEYHLAKGLESAGIPWQIAKHAAQLALDECRKEE